jgi:hypothetical protein
MEIIDKKVAIQKAASAIGKKNGSAPPESTSNTFGAAYELFVASELRSIANKRYDVAKAQAVEAGVIDEEKAIEGAEIATHNNELFDVTLKKASSSMTLDKTALKNNLSKLAGMSDKEATRIIELSSKPRKGAVTIGFSLKG